LRCFFNQPLAEAGQTIELHGSINASVDETAQTRQFALPWPSGSCPRQQAYLTGISFDQPNLPLLIEEIERETLP